MTCGITPCDSHYIIGHYIQVIRIIGNCFNIDIFNVLFGTIKCYGYFIIYAGLF